MEDVSRLLFLPKFLRNSVSKSVKNSIFSKTFAKNSENFPKTQLLKNAYVVKFVKNDPNFPKTPKTF